MTNIFKGNLKFLVLYILSSGAIHGYGLFKELERKFHWKPSCGTLYPVLNDLEEKGFIDGRETVECGRFKKIYSLTPDGRQLLDKMSADLRNSLKLITFNEN
jgi:DNA-binding PadR family transcriptional regulator